MGTAEPGAPLVVVKSLLKERFELLLLALCAGSIVPLWYVDYPPIQDLPQHLAAIRVLHDFDDPALGFARYFEIDLFRTQYLAYYLAADWLAYLLNVELANRVLVSVSLVATPYALRALLSALGRDPRLCVLCLPLLYNAHLILGFLNFLLSIPLAIYGLALAVRQRRAPTRGRALGLALVSLVCFYCHVVPFALLGLGVGLIALQRRPADIALSLLPLAPSGVAALVWLAHSPAGQATLTAATGAESGPKPMFQPPQRALSELPRWMTDVLSGDLDRQLLYVWAGVVGLCLIASLLGGLLGATSDAPDRVGRSLARRLSLLSPLCALSYFVAPTSYDWIWPIAQRFPLLCALLSLIAIGRLPRPLAHGVVLAGALLGAAHFHFIGTAFSAFDREEVGDFEEALAHIPKGQRVVGLIFDRHSRHVAFSPFIHFVAYYQARKGGAVMFTFADFPQSPFRFVETNRPPRVSPRWEWLPARVQPRTDLRWYQYALVRGGPGRIAQPSSGFALRYRGKRWSVYENL